MLKDICIGTHVSFLKNNLKASANLIKVKVDSLKPVSRLPLSNLLSDLYPCNLLLMSVYSYKNMHAHVLCVHP